MRVFQIFGVLSISLAATFAQADDAEQAIRKSLLAIEPDMPIEAVVASPMPGLYQVQLPGGKLLYASADGKFLLDGNLYQMQSGLPVNLTGQYANTVIAKLLAQVPPGEMVVFPAKERKTHITVFTDPDCGYCQKLHTEVPELNRLGIEVRYMAFPRQGQGSHGYNSLVSVWCAKDRLDAMNKAKSRQELPKASCANPVMQQYELGGSIGISGTPAIVLANGQLIPGYQPAPQLAKQALAAK
jgi:thiol:disulfide interchange protein DsbC